MQVDDDATPQAIKTAYRDLTRVCHPDLTGGKGHNICILLNEAYNVLMDSKGRQQYNALLEQALKDAEDDYTGKPSIPGSSLSVLLVFMSGECSMLLHLICRQLVPHASFPDSFRQ